MVMQKCWSCRKCYGGCQWSREFKPAPGWDATPRTYGARPKYGVPEVNSYEIRGCPQYEWDGTDPRDQTDAEQPYQWKSEERMRQVKALAQTGMTSWKISKTLHMSYSEARSYVRRLTRMGELENAQ